jgi:hypothetical protein
VWVCVFMCVCVFVFVCVCVAWREIALCILKRSLETNFMRLLYLLAFGRLLPLQNPALCLSMVSFTEVLSYRFN